MTGVAVPAKCRNCRHFRNDPAYLEAAIKGLSAMSSAWGSVRADDGLCLHHDRYLSAEASCRDFQAEAVTAILC
ncbi:MAG: hypothetical protein EXR00_01860 [Alphaproteobacteria bacterium]|nr:hypothetical protein [Alphaproteobacteria bacterium]